MNDESIMHLTVDSDINTRKGVHADMALVAEREGTVRIDFISADITDNEGNAKGVLTSRVYMSRKDLLSFKNSIDEMLIHHSDQENGDR